MELSNPRVLGETSSSGDLKLALLDQNEDNNFCEL